jgi:tetratricopeptide (TPR) repeat protein
MEEIVQAQELYDKGYYSRTIHALNQIRTSSSPSEDTLILMLFLEAQACTKLDDLTKAQKIIQKIQQSSLDNLPQIPLEIKILQAEIFSRVGDLDRSTALLDHCEEQITLKCPVDSPECHIFLAKIYFVRLVIYWQQGKLNDALEITKKALEINRKYGSEADIAQAIGSYGMIQCERGVFAEGVPALHEALGLVKHGGNIRSISILLNNLGWTSRLQGDLDQARKYLEKSVRLKADGGMDTRTELSNLGTIARQMQNYELSLDYFKKALARARIVGNPIERADILFEQFLTLLEMNDRPQLDDTIRQLQYLSSKSPNRKIALQYQLARALKLKINLRARNIYEAETILKEIIAADVVIHELTVLALFTLAELYLIELRLSNDAEILKEISVIIEKLHIIAVEHNSYYLMSELFLIEAKLALIQLDLTKTRELLTQAQKLAEKYDFFHLAIRISHEHDVLLEKQGLWEEFQRKAPPFATRVELAEIENEMQRMKRQAQSKLPVVSESPIGLLVINENGPLLYSMTLEPDWDGDQQLLAGLLSAFNSLSLELFPESFDRAKFGEHTILAVHISPLLIGYVFKGTSSSYSAKIKLKHFTQEFQQSSQIWESFEQATLFSNMIPHEIIAKLEVIIRDIFLPPTDSKGLLE